MIPVSPPLTPERWRQVKRVMEGALDLTTGKRTAFLDAACADDAELRHDVESLLAAAAGTGVVDRPAAAALDLAHDRARDGADAADPDPADTGALFARVAAGLGEGYALDAEVGRGGMAVVYRARDLRHRRPVALKVLRPDVSALLGRARFEDEVLLAAGLQHAHIVPVLGSGEADGMLWFAMPYVEGGSLRHRLEREGQLSVAEATRLVREVALALDYAHRHGTVHRDIKPENVLLSDGQALVTDFGIAKALHPNAPNAGAGAGRAHTSPGFVLGTPGYMAPEQARGARSIDARTDVYALGVLLHEMLAGVRPFGSEDARVGPRAIRVRRPDVPDALVAVILRALAHDPADRFASAAAFEAAVAGAVTTAPVPARRIARVRRWPPLRAVLGVAAIAAAAAVLAPFGPWHTSPLDPDRVMVFPLAVAPGAAPAGAGADAATLVGYALEGTAPLRWIEAADYLHTSRGNADAPTPAERRALSVAHQAGYYIDGNVVRRGDSSTVVLRLHSVDGDSVVARRGATGHVGDMPVADLGLRAVGELLVPLLAPGRRVDVSALRDRDPAAIAEFLQGEREYRASHFSGALARYRAALERDSLFALAALQGAQAASWTESNAAAAGPLARLAVAHIGSLPPYRAAIARGFLAFTTGSADSAAAEFGRAIALDSTRTEPWMGLGEVYRHLLPHAQNGDSLAEDAYVRARRADTAFTPPLYHLAELAIHRGALARADSYAQAYGRADPDSITRRGLDLALRCARDARTPAWDRAAGEDPTAAMQAGVILAGRPAYWACARRAFTATLGASTASPGLRWMAVLALQSVHVAMGHDAAAVALVQSAAGRALAADRLLVLDALAGAAVGEGAADVVRTIGADYRTFSAPRLWLLGSWYGERGRADDVRAIAHQLAARADSTRARADSLMARAIAARTALADGDTVEAMRRLRALTPSAPSDSMMHDPWECLGGERLLLARLLLARHAYREVRAVAEQLDAPYPPTLLVYRRAALELRLRAAQASGTDDPAARARLAELARAT